MCSSDLFFVAVYTPGFIAFSWICKLWQNTCHLVFFYKFSRNLGERQGGSDMSFIANSCRSRKNMEIKEKGCYNIFESTVGV